MERPKKYHIRGNGIAVEVTLDKRGSVSIDDRTNNRTIRLTNVQMEIFYRHREGTTEAQIAEVSKLAKGTIKRQKQKAFRANGMEGHHRKKTALITATEQGHGFTVWRLTQELKETT